MVNMIPTCFQHVSNTCECLNFRWLKKLGQLTKIQLVTEFPGALAKYCDRSGSSKAGSESGSERTTSNGLATVNTFTRIM
jgi:hypothetical protein